MNDDKAYSIGCVRDTQKQQRKAVDLSVVGLRRLDAKTKRCKRGTKRQTAGCARSHVANGFLATSFLPKFNISAFDFDWNDSAGLERDFYKSLSQLAKHYSIDPMPTESFGYPYNIALALHDLKERLCTTVKNWDKICLIQKNKKLFLETVERYSSGGGLYYIPVLPLFKWMKNPKRKQCAKLLLSVFSYLYHVARIPYYRKKYSYLNMMYEIHFNWVMDDDFEEETTSLLTEIEIAQWVGDRMERKVSNKANLKNFETRLSHFKVRDAVDKACLSIGMEAFKVYRKFPCQSIFRNANKISEDHNVDSDDIIPMNRYISFCADSEGWLMENIMDSINNEFQECSQVEEPIIIKRFDGNPITANSLEFEDRLFKLIDELIYILNNY